jgi:archaellum component FlaC
VHGETKIGKKGMELTMSDNDTNDLNDAVGEIVTRNVPQFITAIIAVFGLVAAYFMTIGDMKVKDAEIQQKITYLEQKVDRVESTMDVIKNKLDARIPVVDNDRQDLRKEIDSLREVLQQMRPMLRK